MDSIGLERINPFVLRKQQLTPDARTDDVAQVADDIGGLHATSATTPYLSLCARCRDFRREGLDAELYERRSLARLRAVRGTIYIYPREFIPVAFAATSRANLLPSQRYLEFRGVSSAEYQSISRAILQALQGREMSALAIRRVLQTDAHIPAVLNLMCDQGLLVRGQPDKGWRDAHHRYAVFGEYLPGLDLTRWSEGEASVQVVRRYLRAFGPVSEQDIAWWTGFTRSRVRAALHELRDELSEIEISGLDGPWLLLRSEVERLRETRPAREPTVNLLPSLDPYLMGYRQRARWLDDVRTECVFDRSGNATNTVLVNGQAAGVWDMAQAGEPAVKLFLFEEVPEHVLEAIHAEAQRVGRFILDQDVAVRQIQEMVPLKRRSAGAVMSPLKGG